MAQDKSGHGKPEGSRAVKPGTEKDYDGVAHDVREESGTGEVRQPTEGYGISGRGSAAGGK